MHLTDQMKQPYVCFELLLISRITAQHDLIGEENIRNAWKFQSLLFISTDELESRI
jgi:hypothetical protein